MTITASVTLPPLDCAWSDNYPAADKGKYRKCTFGLEDVRHPAYMNVSSLSDITWEPKPAGWTTELWDGMIWW